MDDQSQTPNPSHCEQCDAYLAGWKRAQADYQNLKKETEREKGEFARYANERLLSELLPAIDQFGLAMGHVPDVSGLPEDQRKAWANWLTGLSAVRSSWDQAASSVGLERIPAGGAFDPLLHDAAGEEASDKPAGTILKVLQDGWRLHGKVLRPARVIISK